MLKRTCITLIILTSFSFANNLKAQTPTKDTATYEYAILKYEKGPYRGSNFSLVVFFENYQFLDIYEKLRLDTVKVSGETDIYTFILKSLNFMDKLGYELVTSAISKSQYSPLIKEYIFRKKKVK